MALIYKMSSNGRGAFPESTQRVMGKSSGIGFPGSNFRPLLAYFITVTVLILFVLKIYLYCNIADSTASLQDQRDVDSTLLCGVFAQNATAIMKVYEAFYECVVFCVEMRCVHSGMCGSFADALAPLRAIRKMHLLSAQWYIYLSTS